MGRLDGGYKWYIFLYYDKEYKELYKILDFATISEVSYILDLKPQTISNYYHKLIKPRGVLKNVNIFRGTG